MQWPSKKRRLLSGLIVAAVIGAALCLAFAADGLLRVQLQCGDLLLRAGNLHQAAAVNEAIVIVGIDDKSLEELGRFSHWPRCHHARLVDTVAEAGARTIAFDVLFAEPAPGDDVLAASIRNAGNVVLPVVHTIGAATVPAEIGHSSASSVRPIPILEEAAVAVGHVSVFHDPDGVVRRVPVTVADEKGYEPALALAAVAGYLRRSEVLDSAVEGNAVSFAGRSIPVDGDSGMLVNYNGGRRGHGQTLSFGTVSFVDVMNGGIDPAFFEDKIVLVGATAGGLGDTFWTPMGEIVYGVEIHASAIETILSGDFLRPPCRAMTVVSILLLAVVAGGAVLRLRLTWAVLSVALLCLLYSIVAFSLFDRGMLLNMLYPPLAIIGASVGVGLHNVTSERAEKRAVTRTFGRYISPSVVEATLGALGAGQLKLGGQEQEVTVAFADVRGFTAASEKMQPDELVRVLNIYLSKVIQAVLDHGGMINKFGGDSVMAVWNVPNACPDHAFLAVKSAVTAQAAITELHAEADLPRMDWGIGINTGKAVAGNMGCEDRLEYSVIGDAVNTAARLAGATPGGKVWIGAGTFEPIKDLVTAEALPPLTLRGKQDTVEAYEVVNALDVRLSRSKV